MKFFLGTIAALTILIGVPLASAQPAGHEAPTFKQAVQAWLDDDDQTALPALAKLAREDNRAAQVLLGRIATRPMGPWLVAMGRKERNGLLRAPGGLSGTSWLKVAAEVGDPLAQLFIDAEDPRADEDTIQALAEAGEAMSAAKLSLYFWDRKGVFPSDLMLELWKKGVLPSEFAIHFARRALRNDALSQLEILRLQVEAPFPTNRIIDAGLANGASDGAAWHKAISDWYEAAEARKDKQEYRARSYYAEPNEMRRLTARHVCDRRCGKETDNAIYCMAIVTNLGPSPVSMMRIGTPLEVLIPQADFALTPRAEFEMQDLLRNDYRMKAFMNAKENRLPSCIPSALGFN